MSDNNNPYRPPDSDVTPQPDGGHYELLPEPRSLPASAGLGWITQSWPLVKSDLMVWVLIVGALLGIHVLLGLVPGIGDIVSSIIGPVFTGGILMGVRDAHAGQKLRFDYLFEGFKQKFAPLAGLGLATLGISFLFVMVIAGVFAATNADLLQGEPLRPEEVLGAFNTGLMVIGVLLLIFVLMLLWFATQLVALNDVPVLQSLGMSLKACLRNPLPLMVYFFLMLGLAILGAIPFLLGLLIVVPMLFASMYISYGEIFLK